MRLTSLLVVLASLAVAGCAGHSADCVVGTGQTGCAPGTEGYRRMHEQQADTKATSEIDDARCRSYGVADSPAYLACRRKTSADRKSYSAPDASETRPLPKAN